MFMFIIAQLWKYNNGRLENKNGDWMYMEETWILPSENKTKGIQEGQVIRNSLFPSFVLKADSNSRGNHLKLQLKTSCIVEI